MTKRLDRMEAKLDKILEQTTENRVTIDNHIKQDKWSYRVTTMIVLFIFSVHTADVLKIMNKKSGLPKQESAYIKPDEHNIIKLINKDKNDAT